MGSESHLEGWIQRFAYGMLSVLHHIVAHDLSVTSLQFDNNFLVTGRNDGCVWLFKMQTGAYMQELSNSSKSVWKVAYGKESCAIMCKRVGHTVMEVMRLKEM